MHEAFRLIALAVVAFAAAMLAAVTGFGGAAVLLPMLVLVFGVREAIPILTVAQLIGNGSRVWFNRRELDWKVVSWFALGGVPTAILVLLCYKCGAPQKGQLWSCRRRTREIVCLSVAIEPGLCRSGRTRRSPRTELGRHFGDG
jgi:hypothetical protein